MKCVVCEMTAFAPFLIRLSAVGAGSGFPSSVFLFSQFIAVPSERREKTQGCYWIINFGVDFNLSAERLCLNSPEHFSLFPRAHKLAVEHTHTYTPPDLLMVNLGRDGTAPTGSSTHALAGGESEKGNARSGMERRLGKEQVRNLFKRWGWRVGRRDEFTSNWESRDIRRD